MTQWRRVELERSPVLARSKVRHVVFQQEQVVASLMRKVAQAALVIIDLATETSKLVPDQCILVPIHLHTLPRVCFVLLCPVGQDGSNRKHSSRHTTNQQAGSQFAAISLEGLIRNFSLLLE